MQLQNIVLFSLSASLSLSKVTGPVPRGLSNGPVIERNFPDPAFIAVKEGFYAFATNSSGRNIPVATSPNFKKWTVTEKDALSSLPPWVSPDESKVWSPHVFKVGEKFILYYAAVNREDETRHCLGIATSSAVGEPYKPTSDKPFKCSNDQGGVIGPVSFQDSDGSRYIVYKVDGSAKGKTCSDLDHSYPTPLMLQKMKADGITADGEPVQLLDHDKSDGPLIEAPSLVKSGDKYVLFFSSHCFNSPNYDTKYATSDKISGPYVRASKPLLESGGAGGRFHSPGSAMVGPGGRLMVFHNDKTPGSAAVRQMWTAEIKIEDGKVSLT